MSFQHYTGSQNWCCVHTIQEDWLLVHYSSNSPQVWHKRALGSMNQIHAKILLIIKPQALSAVQQLSSHPGLALFNSINTVRLSPPNNWITDSSSLLSHHVNYTRLWGCRDRNRLSCPHHPPTTMELEYAASKGTSTSDNYCYDIL